MERSEPSLVPEWLKGASGGGGATHHTQSPSHQDESGGSFPNRQRTQPHAAATGVNQGDYDSPRYAAVSERAYYPSSRRGTGNTAGSSERPVFDRDFSRAYSSFGRSAGYRAYDGIEREREGPRDWDWERERDREFRDRERDRSLGFGGGDDRDRDRERSDPAFRRPASGSSGRYDADVPLRRSQSMGASRVVENGEKKATGEVGTLPTAPPANSGSLTSSMQKAAFERNFPSLGAQERQGAVQSSLGNVSVLSPRPSWQASSPRPEGGRAAVSASGLPSVVSVSTPAGPSVGVSSSLGVEGWSSALAEAPSALTGNSSSIAINGVVAGVNVQPCSNSGVPAVAATGTMPVPVLSVPKMAEALSQNPPRVRTPPQFSLESQRMEETVLKQSRQLIPMKPPLPKNMGPRDKTTKPKVVRAVDVLAPPSIKLNQPLGPSQLMSSPYRPPVSSRTEILTLKAPPGKLLVRKTKEVAAVPVPAIPMKADGGSATLPLIATGATLCIPGTASSAMPSSTLTGVPRKQKQLLDRRAVPIPPISVQSNLEVGSGLRVKDGGPGCEDKRAPVSAQNRSDFFNALRKKAAGTPINLSNLEKPDTVQSKTDRENSKGVDVLEDGSSSPNAVSRAHIYEVMENGTIGATANPLMKGGLLCSDIYVSNEDKEVKVTSSNGVLRGGEEAVSEASTAPNSPIVSIKRATATEEEEAAFLRSLGWEESADLTEGEGLTEEEINSFYQERLRSISISPSLGNVHNQHLRTVQVGHHVGSIGSVSSGISSSDSESDDELHMRRRS